MTVQTLQPVQLPSASRAGQGTLVEQSRAVAEVHGAIVVAQQVPRDVTRAVSDMHRSCAQKSLAEKAFFRFPRGKDPETGKTLFVSGPSVQLARELARCFGNMQFGLVELRRDDGFGQSEMQAWAWDVQTNTRSSTTFIVQHVRDSKAGTTVLTDQRDIYENNANNGARRLREMIFAILPCWFTEDAVAACYDTIANDGADGALPERIEKAVSGFAQMGITVTQIEQKLGAPRARWTAYDMAQLTVIYRSLVRGEIRKEDEFPAAGRLTAADVTSQPAKPAAAGPAETNGTAPAGPAPAAAPAVADKPADKPAAPAAPPAGDVQGSVTKEQVDELWAIASTRFGFTRDDKAQWRQACEKILGRKLLGGTIGNLSASEAEGLFQVIQALGSRDDLLALLAQKSGEA